MADLYERTVCCTEQGRGGVEMRKSERERKGLRENRERVGENIQSWAKKRWEKAIKIPAFPLAAPWLAMVGAY